MENTIDIEEFNPSDPCDEDREIFNELSKDWSRIYKRFLKDFEKLQAKAGGKEKLTLSNDYGTSIYGYRLRLE